MPKRGPKEMTTGTAIFPGFFRRNWIALGFLGVFALCTVVTASFRMPIGPKFVSFWISNGELRFLYLSFKPTYVNPAPFLFSKPSLGGIPSALFNRTVFGWIVIPLWLCLLLALTWISISEWRHSVRASRLASADATQEIPTEGKA